MTRAVRYVHDYIDSLAGSTQDFNQRAKLQPRSVMKSYPVNATCNRYIYGWALGAGLTPGVHRVAPPLSLLYLLVTQPSATSVVRRRARRRESAAGGHPTPRRPEA